MPLPDVPSRFFFGRKFWLNWFEIMANDSKTSKRLSRAQTKQDKYEKRLEIVVNL